MKYALGNMLNGAGGLNPDGLALDLQFAADKTLTARKGPTPVFTRGSGNNGGTTYFGPSIINVVYSYLGTSYNVDVTQRILSGVFNGRWKWGDGFDVELFYTGTAWTLSHNSNTIATSASATNAWRPDLANWSGTGATVTTGNTFGIVKAANDEPRFDHDPVTLASRGLLIEENRENLFTQSEAWQTGANFTGPTTPTITSNTTTSPDGQLTADTLSGSTGTAVDGNVNSTWRQPNISSATAYTFSIYVRSLGVATKAEIRIRDNSSGASAQTLDTSLTSSWKRISVTATTGPTTTSIRCIIQNTDGPIAIWGAQLEAGSFPTSYIPTTTGTLTRSADVCSITGGDFNSLNTSPSFSVLCNFSALATTQALAMAPVGLNQSSANGVFLYKFNNSTSFGVYHVSNNAIIGSISSNVLAKSALAYDGDSVVGVLSGGAVSAETGASALTFVEMTIGNTRQGGNKLSGHISAIRYYKRRLPNAKLQAITV